jgi:hypothetical protein
MFVGFGVVGEIGDRFEAHTQYFWVYYMTCQDCLNPLANNTTLCVKRSVLRRVDTVHFEQERSDVWVYGKSTQNFATEHL